jgi:predicted site-specific integrase-resolvase
MKLSAYARELGLTYRTAWNLFNTGHIKGAYKLPTGTVIVPDFKEDKKEYTAVYARVSSSENKSNLISQSIRVQEFCSAKGWQVKEVIEECASGLNDKRPKLIKLLKNKSVTRIVVEHKDRLTRFGFNYIQQLWDGDLIVINEVKEDEKDLMQDFVSLVTCFTARLYGQRRTKRKTEQLIKSLKDKA